MDSHYARTINELVREAPKLTAVVFLDSTEYVRYGRGSRLDEAHMVADAKRRLARLFADEVQTKLPITTSFDYARDAHEFRATAHTFTNNELRELLARAYQAGRESK